MKVYLFSDYLKTIHGDPLQESQSICEIVPIDSFPDGLIRINGKIARACSFSKGELYIEFMGKMLITDEVYSSQEITCPHCGNENGDSWEADDSDDNLECDACNSIFSYQRNVEVTYSSQIIERNDIVLPLT